MWRYEVSYHNETKTILTMNIKVGHNRYFTINGKDVNLVENGFPDAHFDLIANYIK